MLRSAVYALVLLLALAISHVKAQKTTDFYSQTLQTLEGNIRVSAKYVGSCAEIVPILVTYRLKRNQNFPETTIAEVIDKTTESLRSICPKVKIIDISAASNNWALGNRYFRVSAKGKWKARKLKDDEIFGVLEKSRLPSKLQWQVKDHTKLLSWRPGNNPYLTFDVYQTGVCAQRVGLSLVSWHSVNGFKQRIIEGHELTIIEKAVKALTDRCPQLEILDVRNVGTDTQQLLSKAYSKARGWRQDPSASMVSKANQIFDLAGQLKTMAIGINDSSFSGGYWGKQWGRLEGDVQYPTANFKIKSMDFNGFWYEHGSSSQHCPKPRNGFAYWGRFHFGVQVDGKLIPAKRTFCNDKDNFANAENNWLPITGMRGQKNAMPLIKMPWLARAQLEKDQLKLQAAASGQISDEDLNPLAYLGYSNSKLVHQHRGVKYYFVDHFWYFARFVSIHDVSDSVPVLDIETGSIEKDGKIVSAFRLKDRALNEYSKTILPALESHTGEKKVIRINHYAKSRTLKNSYQLSRRGVIKNIEPVIRTEFRRENKTWSPFYTDRVKNLFILGEGYANTVDEAMVVRNAQNDMWNEQQRVAKLSNRQKAEERMAKVEAADKLKREKAKQQGTVFRDWLYWQQYANGSHYQSIFDGEYNAKLFEQFFPHLYLRFFGTYSAFCSSLVPEGSPGYDYYTNTTVDSGYFKNELERYDGSIKVKGRYWKPFQRYHQNPPMQRFINDGIKAAMGQNNLRGVAKYIGDTTKFFTDINNDYKLMFDNEGCESGFIQQMEENYFRAATNAAYLQQSSKRLPYFDSDKGGKNPTSEFYQSCIRASGTSKRDIEWCNCLDSGAKKSYTPQEYAKYSKDHWQLLKDTRDLPRSAKGKEWRLYNVLNECRR